MFCCTSQTYKSSDSEDLCNLRVWHNFSVSFFAQLCALLPHPLTLKPGKHGRRDTDSDEAAGSHKGLRHFTMRHHTGLPHYWGVCVRAPGNLCLLSQLPVPVDPHLSIAEAAAGLWGLCEDRHSAHDQHWANLLAKDFSLSQWTCSLSSGWLFHGDFQHGGGFGAGASMEIWLRHGSCQIPTSCQSISIINNGRIKCKASTVFPEWAGVFSFTASCSFLKDSDPAWMQLLERPLPSFKFCSSHLYHTCTVRATGWGGHQKEQMLFLAQTCKEHFTDSTGPSLPRQSIWCTLSFPLCLEISRQWSG